jgi:hypothetical protein
MDQRRAATAYSLIFTIPGLASRLTVYRNVRPGLRHAVLPRAIRHLFLPLSQLLLASSPQTHSFEYPYSNIFTGTSDLVNRGLRMRWTCGHQPCLPELSHPETGPSWMYGWRCDRRSLVFGHNNPETIWLDRLGSGHFPSEVLEDEGLSSHRRPRRCRLGPLGVEAESQT